MGVNKLGGTGLKARVAVVTVVCIWIYNVAFNIPMLMWANVHRGSRMNAIVCHPRTLVPAYALAARVLNFYVPLIINWTSYIGIIYKLKRTMNKAICHICCSYLHLPFCPKL